MKAIVNGKIITEDCVLHNKVLLFSEKIIDIIDINDFKEHLFDVIDAGGNFVSPGFIDIHIHGFKGKDTMDAEINSIKVISSNIVKYGVTSFLPTTMTMPIEMIYKALDVVRISKNMNLGGARILGANLEGPFISKKYKGAHDEKYILSPSFDLIKDYMDLIKIITIAPEEDYEFRFLNKMREFKDVVLSIGHTDADFETAIKAIKLGVKHATHTFNAMTPLNHRKPGALGAVLSSNITCEVIADNVHIHPAVLDILIKLKGVDSVVLISDSIRAGGMDDGVYDLGGQQVFVSGGCAVLKDGTLAGSTLTLNKAILNILEVTGVDIVDAVKMATINPAKVIGIDKYKASIKKGKDADIIVFDEKIDILHTFVEGEEVYKKQLIF